MQMLNSVNGDAEDLLSGIPQALKEKGVLSFLGGATDDLSLALHID